MKALSLFFFLFFLLLESVQGRALLQDWGLAKRNEPDPRVIEREIPLPIDTFSDENKFPAVTTVYRADSRSFDDVQKAGGFFPRPGKETPAKYSLWSHVQGVISNTAYVSTTEIAGDRLQFYAENAQRVPSNKAGKSYIYKIESSRNFVDVNKSLRLVNYLGNAEHAAIGGIRANQIVGWAEATPEVLQLLKNGKSSQISWTPNDKYTPLPAQFRGSSVRPELAGFPDNHPAWKSKPWSDIRKSNGGAAPDVTAAYNKVLNSVPNTPRLGKGPSGLPDAGVQGTFKPISEDPEDDDVNADKEAEKLRAQRARQRLRDAARAKEEAPEEEGPDDDESGEDNEEAAAAARARQRLRAQNKPKEQPAENVDADPAEDNGPSDDGEDDRHDEDRAARARARQRQRERSKPKDRSSDRHDDDDDGDDDVDDNNDSTADRDDGSSRDRARPSGDRTRTGGRSRLNSGSGGKADKNRGRADKPNRKPSLRPSRSRGRGRN